MRNKIYVGILTILLAACGKSVASPPDVNVILSDLTDVPLYSDPGLIWEGIPGRDIPEGHTIYSYFIQDERESIEKFYREEMQSAGWELLGLSDDKTGAMFWFAKKERIASISIIPWSVSYYLVTIDITIDPAYGM